MANENKNAGHKNQEGSLDAFSGDADIPFASSEQTITPATPDERPSNEIEVAQQELQKHQAAIERQEIKQQEREPRNKYTNGLYVLTVLVLFAAATVTGVCSSGNCSRATAPLSPRIVQTPPIRAEAASAAASNSDGHVGDFVVKISEFLASNSNGLRDQDGKACDWIELQHTGNISIGDDNVIDIGNYSLTDDHHDPSKWTFPSPTNLRAGDTLVIFCSGKNRRESGQELHSNFKLSAGGGYVGLYNSEGVLVSHYTAYPQQTADRSYGFDEDNQLVGFFSTPTPGAANGGADVDVLASVGSGFYDTPFQLALNTTENSRTARILFTLDGSAPGPGDFDTTFTYTSAIEISTTTVLRAAAFLGETDDDRPLSPVSTQTFVFLQDVMKQPREIPGIPSDVHKPVIFLPELPHVLLDMEMDPAIVEEYASEIKDGMKAIPTLSIASSPQIVFGNTGFYRGEDKFKSCSLEVLYANDPTRNEQINVGVKGHSNPFLKRSLRLEFRKQHGDSYWKTDLLQQQSKVNEQSASGTQRSLVLRAGNQRSWARAYNPDATSYTIDQFYRESQIVMSGGVGSHGVFVHLYLNGVYWGVYNLVERPDDDFAAQYFGGDSDDWFHTNHGGAGPEKRSRWEFLTQELAQTTDMTVPENYATLQDHLNVTSFVDYCLLAFFMGMTDWPDNNWYAIHRLESHSQGATPAEFICWDGEQSLDRHAYDKPEGADVPYKFRSTADIEETNPILDIWRAAIRNKDFQALIGDRAAVHTAPGGALSTNATLERWDSLNLVIESAIIGESARWGDSLKSLGSPYDVTRTRNVDWRNEVASIRAILEINTDLFLEKLISEGW